MNDSVKPAGASSVDESAIGTGSLATTSRSAPAPGRGSTSARRRDPAGRGSMKRQALQDPGPVRRLSPLDRLLTVVTRGLADATTEPVAGKPSPARGLPEGLPKEGTPGSSHGEGTPDPARYHAAGLMRVNHVGEVCAQALYEGHALTVKDDRLAMRFLAAADEEHDHLAWTSQRLRELDARPSVLMPLWYLGSLAIGAAAGLAVPRHALGFMAETERQVEAHLQGHLEKLPPQDERSRAIVARMKTDEARHADDAMAAGAASMPAPVRGFMRAMSKVMTTVAYRL